MRFRTLTVAGALLALTAGLQACGDRGGGVNSGPHGPIGRACLASNSAAAGYRTCGCIQGVADQMLSSRDQARAVKFFRDPELAQTARTADSRSAEAFWERYSAFGTAAEASCSGL